MPGTGDPEAALSESVASQMHDEGYPHTLSIPARRWPLIRAEVMAWRGFTGCLGRSRITTPWYNAPTYISFADADDAFAFRLRFS